MQKSIADKEKVKKSSYKQKEDKKSVSSDIIKIILEDHKPLKELLKVLKDEDGELSEKKEAFRLFYPQLLKHAKTEEKTLYAAMKSEDEFRMESFEGETEHSLAERMVEEVSSSKDEDQWCAKAKVLAELVEHHIEEEEEEIFPDFKKKSTKEERNEIGENYLQLKTKLEH